MADGLKSRPCLCSGEQLLSNAVLAISFFLSFFFYRVGLCERKWLRTRVF